MNTSERPDWAPDECPDEVVELITIESQLEALGLRGLASSDSMELRTGFRRLANQLKANYQRGRRDGLVIGCGVALVLAGLAFALA